MTELVIELLGPVRALVDGEQVELPGGRTPGLLAALALTRGRPVRAGALAEILWDGEPPPKWETSLYSRLSRLRRALGSAAPAIRTTGAGYSLDLADGALDVARFERLAGEGRTGLARGDVTLGIDALGRSLGTWRGPAFGPLAELDHFRAAAHALEEQRLSVFEALADARLARGEHDEVVAALEEHVQAAQFRERGWALLITALYRCGRQADALRRAAEVRHLLGTELGIEPGPELRALERAVLDHDRSLVLAPDRPPAPAPPIGAPAAYEPPAWLREPENRFVGRAREVDRLGAAWARVQQGESRFVLLAGEPGLGKTRLVAHWLAANGATFVFAGRCDEDPLLPYQPIAEALAPASTEPGFVEALGASAGALALVLPDLIVHHPTVRPLDAGDADAARAAAVAAIGRLRRWRAADRPVVLVVDDLQWAPSPAVRLLRHLFRTRALDPVLVIATARTDERSADVEHALETWERERWLDRVVLRSLPDADVTSLAEARQATPSIAARARELADGNPFFVEELVRHLLESGEAPDGRRVPETVRSTVERRLRRLSASTREALDHGALIGADFDIELLERTITTDVAIGEALDAAMTAGLVRPSTPRTGSIAFGHAIVREVLLDGIGPARRARIHAALASVLTELAIHAPHRLRARAHHATEAARDVASAHMALDAARDAAALATRSRNYDDAERVMARALHRCTDLLEPGDPKLLALRVSHADARARCGATQEAAEALWTIARDAFDAGEFRLAARAINIGMSWLSTPQTDLDALIRAVRDALEGDDDDDTLLFRLNAVDLSDLAAVQGSLPIVHATVAAIDASPRDDHTRATLLYAAAAILEVTEPPSVSLPVYRAQLEAARRSGDPKLIVSAATECRSALLAAGAYDEAEALNVEYEQRAIDARIPRYLAGLEQRRAMRALLEGRFTEAEAHANAAVELQPTQEMLEGYAVQIFGLRKEQGRLVEIADAVREYGERSSHPAWRTSYAMLLAEIGDVDAARATLEPVLALSWDAIAPDRYGATFFAVCAEASELLADAELAARVLPHLRRLLNPVLVVPASTVCWGAIDRFVAPALARLGDTDGARAAFGRSIHLHERFGARPFLARDQLGLAGLLESVGEHDEARARRSAGLRLARELGMAGLLARVGAAKR
jgi:DNA-binding SARP family transcriptional activator